MSQRSLSSFIPGYKENAVLQLVVATAVGYILYNFTRVSFIVFGKSWGESLSNTLPYIGLAPVKMYAHRWWTILTYGWIHKGFFEWVSNAIWLYTFGSVVQMLIGHRQVIPLFIYGLIGGGILCLLSQLIPGAAMDPSNPYEYLATAMPGIMALMAGALTISPRYRFYLGENLSIPLILVVAIYLVLNVLLYSSGRLPLLMLAVGGGVTGYVTMTLLKRGYRPGNWMYGISGNMQRMATPDEDKLRRQRATRRTEAMNAARTKITTQQRIDAILDKINQRGYASLTKEERDLLQKESGNLN